MDECVISCLLPRPWSRRFREPLKQGAIAEFKQYNIVHHIVGGAMNRRIVVLPGDGIGREIMPQAVRVLEAIGQKCGHHFTFTYGQVGGEAIDATGFPLPA